MSIRMNDFIDIIERRVDGDAEGFGRESDVILASVRAEKSYAAMAETDRNGAAFAVQTAVFKLRRIPGLAIQPDLFITDAAGRYNITAVDEMSGRGMYIVATARLVTASEG
ncbi:MAG: head-tail adaptor protein [Synergistaceae bacterium]|nr:head-tail adaptor protein [Synergistaceae bacterium]